MKTRTKSLAAVVAATLCITAFAGCSDNSNSGSGNAGNGTTTTAATNAAKAADTTAADNNTPADTTAAQNTSSGDKTNITVWAPEALVEFTQGTLDTWLAGQADWNGKFGITVSAMGEGDAATQLLTDVEAGADVFAFAQDQLARLVAAGALSKPGGVFLEHVTQNNDAGAVSAVTLNGDVYAYPETSDNGYFLFYDKSVVTDPSTLDGVLEQCGAAGKKMYMDLQSGWYDTAFFFGTGAQCFYSLDSDGNIVDCTCDYDSDKGLSAFKTMIALASNPNFSQSTGSDAALFDPNGGTAGAIVSGTWDAATISGFLGDNFGAAKLPTMTVDGAQVQMSGFGGFKLIGVKPQTDSEKLTFCHLVADYLTSEDVQKARFDTAKFGPSNLNAQQSDAVKADAALAALAEQLNFTIAQGQYPNDYWSLTEGFGTKINMGEYNGLDDDALMAALKDLADSIRAAR